MNLAARSLLFLSSLIKSITFCCSLKKEIDLELSTKIDKVGLLFSKVIVVIFGLIINNNNKNKEIDLSIKSKVLLLAFVFILYKY